MMRQVVGLLIASALCWLARGERQTIDEAIVAARHMVHHETIGTLGSTFTSEVNSDLAGQPFALMDYFADCSDNGNPTLIMMTVEISFRNNMHGSKLTLSLRQHPEEPVYSIARLPRLALFGNVTEVTDESERERIKTCYLSKHRDAAFWAPGEDVHPASWYTFNVENIYWFGGFGNESYIGYLPVDKYQQVTLDQIEAYNSRTELSSDEPQSGDDTAALRQQTDYWAVGVQMA